MYFFIELESSLKTAVREINCGIIYHAQFVAQNYKAEDCSV